MNPKDLTTDRKALTINLDPQIYGTFAEIGAGQEVARHFFKVGGAAGSIAKSMSAYDMKFSDEIYGKSDRYVSLHRLFQMLDHEYNLLIERLKENRGDRTCFFVYANTVATRSFKGNNECHGWMGVRFQEAPLAEHNDIIIHVRMLDKTASSQQDALGIIGVNLLYAAFLYMKDSTSFIESLADNLGTERIEVDMINFRGPVFKQIDNRIASLQLVEKGLTNAVLFSPNNEVLQPSEALYKKTILVERGSFRPVTNINIDIISCAGAQLIQEPNVVGEEVFPLMEITMHNLLAEGFNLDDFIARVEVITALGYNVMISNYPEYFRLSSYFRRYTKKMIGMALGINHLLEVFDESYYQDLEGGILESCGRLFKENVKLYVYPMDTAAFNQYLKLKETAQQTSQVSKAMDKSVIGPDLLVTADNVLVHQNLRSLYNYLRENHFIEAIHGYNPNYLHIFSREILKQIKDGNPDWEKCVPQKAADLIKAKKLFGFGGKKSAGESSQPTAAQT